MSADTDAASRYRLMSDAELLELSREGADAYRPEAWSALQAELAGRAILMPAPEGVAALADAADRERVLALPPAEALTGVGGWLAVFVVLSFVGSAYDAAAAVTAFRGGMPWMALGLASFSAAYLVGLRMIGRRDLRAPTYWRALLIAHAVWHAVGAFALGLPTNSAVASAFLRVAWLLYWDTSVRVRNTFAAPAG